MIKISAVLLTVFIAGALCVGQNASTGQTHEKKATSTKEARWQGHIVRFNKEKSSMSVRGGMGNMESTERQIFYDSATEWTKLGKPAKQSEFTDGAFVIVLGKIDHKGVFHASRVDLRLSR
jgi:hypothetical protein